MAFKLKSAPLDEHELSTPQKSTVLKSSHGSRSPTNAEGLEEAATEIDSPIAGPSQAVDLPKGMSTPPARAKPRSHNLWEVKEVTPGGKHQVQVNKQTNRDVIAPITPEDVTPRQRMEQLYNIRKPERQETGGRGRGRPRIWQDVSRGDGYVEQVHSATNCKLLLKESPGGRTTSKKETRLKGRMHSESSRPVPKKKAKKKVKKRRLSLMSVGKLEFESSRIRERAQHSVLKE